MLAVVLSAEGVPPALRENGAAFVSVESAARTLGRVAERAAWLRRPQGRLVAIDSDRERARGLVEAWLERDDDVWLEPGQARELLGCYGVALVPERPAATAEEAAAAAEELGFPVVVKTAAPGAHKTETGGVALDLADERQVRDAAERIGGPLVVQPLVVDGVELLAGVVADPVFGPLVAFGAGGVYTELFGQAAFRIAPLTDLDAAELVQSGAAGTLVRGFRGKPPADAACLEDLLLRLSALADEVPELAELDLNPVIALADRCVAVDLRLRLRRPAETPTEKGW
jgi:acyl-CoA synthetase (NDP forming)